MKRWKIKENDNPQNKMWSFRNAFNRIEYVDKFFRDFPRRDLEGNYQVKIRSWAQLIPRSFIYIYQANIFCFDVTNRASFEDMISSIRVEYIPRRLKYDTLVIVGNFDSMGSSIEHIIKQREVLYEEAVSFAKEVDALYMEASVVSGTNCELIFH
jgi:GTPase SAR1 family protein